MDRILLTASQARNVLGVSRTTLWRIVRKYNQLPIAQTATRGKQKIHYFDSNEVIKLRSQRQPNS
jgi:predicted DNA-binding protein (UPF0251 family)